MPHTQDYGFESELTNYAFRSPASCPHFPQNVTLIPRLGEGKHIAFILEESLDDIIKDLEAEGIPDFKGSGVLPQVFCEEALVTWLN